MQASHNIANEEVKIGKTIQLDHIVFETTKSNLLAKSFEQLDQLVQLMTEHPNMEIEIHGHTDSKGAANYNQKLSESRTKSVYQYLINKRIKAGRMKYIGYGEDRPIANNETAEGRQLNRRVEFVITKVEKDDKPLKTKIEAKSKSISMSTWRMHEGNEGILNQVPRTTEILSHTV